MRHPAAIPPGLLPMRSMDFCASLSLSVFAPTAANLGSICSAKRRNSGTAPPTPPTPRAKAGSRHSLPAASATSTSASPRICRSDLSFPAISRPESLLPLPHKRCSYGSKEVTSLEKKKMLIDRHTFVHLQAAFDHVTAAYKIQVGDRTAWSDFYDSVHHGLNAFCKPSQPFGASYEYAEAVGMRALELRLKVLAEYPELLVRSGGAILARTVTVTLANFTLATTCRL